MEYLNVPSARFAQRLDVARYDGEAPLQETPLRVHQVCISLKQHIGTPPDSIVSVGERVKEGQMIALASRDKMSVNLHASITGVVSGVTDKAIRISAERGGNNV
jgi:Na+-translocating ferredoxin:NAD+ oxidoreductase RnfC subunit